MDEKMRQTILDHLLTRPISSIVINSPEKDFDVALKMMCVVDYYVEESGLYSEINAVPKLLEQLMRFRFFGSFKFCDYILKKSLLGNKLLQCESCEFIGPYIITLDHMVLSHDRHKSGMICQYCNTTPLRIHEQYHTLENCYANYKIRQQINSNYECAQVINDFYSLVRRIALKLGVNIKRREIFVASAKTKEPVIIEIEDDDDDESSVIKNEGVMHQSTIYRSKKSMNLSVLNDMFQDAMRYFNISIEEFMPITATDDASSDTIQTVETISTIPGHITATTCYSDGSSNSSPLSYNSSYPSPTMSSSTLSKMQPPATLGRMMAPSVYTYSPPYTPPMHFNDNLSPPVHQTNAPNMGSTMKGINTTNAMNMMNGPNEMGKFLHFIGSTLNNISNESIRRKTKLQIQQLVLQSSAEDMNLQYNM